MLTEETYRQAVEKYADSVFRFVLKSTQDEDLSKDIVQEAFSKMWERRNAIEFTKSKSWLFTTAYRLLLNDVRRKSVARTFSEREKPTSQPHKKYTQFELKDTIDKALEQLPHVQKSILLLRDLEGYSYDDIGEILDLSAAKVKVYLFRARGKVKALLKNKLVFS